MTLGVFIAITITIVCAGGWYWWRMKTLAALPLTSHEISISVRGGDSTPVKVVVIGTTATPMIELASYRIQPTDHLDAVSLAPDNLNGLSNLLGHTVVIALQSVAAGNTAFTLTFAPEIAHQLANGSLQMMQSLDAGLRAMAVNRSGQIVGQASLIPAAPAATLMTSAWHMMAFVTGQYYLKDINARLARIESLLVEIKTWLVAEQHASLTSHIRYLQHVRTTIMAGNLTDAETTTFLTKLEDIDHDCERLLELLMQPVVAQQDVLRRMDLRGVFTISDTLDALQKHLKTYTVTATTWLDVAQVKIATAHIRCALPAKQAPVTARMQALHSHVQAWIQDQDAFLTDLAGRTEHLQTSIEQLRFLPGVSNTPEREQFTAAIATCRKALETTTERVSTDIDRLHRQIVGHPAELDAARVFVIETHADSTAPTLYRQLPDSSRVMP